MSDRPQDIWLAGDENIHLISDLLEPRALILGNDLGRRTGRTSKLALHYAMLALKVPGQRVIVLDHHDSKEAHHLLLILVTKILDALKFDHNIGVTQRGEFSPDGFTGVRSLPDAYFIIALPHINK